jgi:hypothetical protein
MDVYQPRDRFYDWMEWHMQFYIPKSGSFDRHLEITMRKQIAYTLFRTESPGTYWWSGHYWGERAHVALMLLDSIEFK